MKDAAGVPVPGRRHRPAQARQEHEPLGAGRYSTASRVISSYPNACDVVRVPPDDAAGDEARVLYQPQSRVGVRVGLHESRLVEDGLVRGGADGLGGARDVADQIGNHKSRPEAGPVLVTATHYYLRAGLEPHLPGRIFGKDAGHLVRRGHPAEQHRVEVGGREHLRGPVLLRTS